MTLGGQYATRNYTIKHLQDLKGKTVLTETMPFTTSEATAAQEAGIDTLKVKFDPRNTASAIAIRNAAPNTFMTFCIGLTKVATVDEAVRAGFVKHARSYAATHDIPVSAFRSVGVSDIALAEAGFDLGFGNRGKSAVKSSAARQRAPKVSQSTIRSHILAVKGSFTLNDIMGDVGGSIGTVNTVVKDLIGEGLLKSKGPDADHQGRGRAPIRYATV